MEKEYLDFMCEKQAIIIFESELNAYGYPNSLEEIDRLKDKSLEYLSNLRYNFREKEIIESKLKGIFRDYKNAIFEIGKAYS